MNDISNPDSNMPVEVKVSRLAIIAISLAFCGLLYILILPLSLFSLLIFRLGILFYYLSNILLVSAIILGIISMIRINLSGGRKTGHGFALGAIIIPLATLFISWMFLPLLARINQEKYRLSCGNNLHAIGKAMLIYANDHDDKFPRSGGKESTWGTNVNWYAENNEQAFGINSDGIGGSVTVSSFLYLLVKYAEVRPETFICAMDRKVSKFDLLKYNKTDKDYVDFWDFGPDPWKHCSYSYYMMYGQYQLTTSSNAGMAVAADRNPWIPSCGWNAKDFAAFNPDGDRKNEYAGNSPVHFNQGQYVLYLDTHVNFENVSFCGINDDNIYTSWNGNDIRKGTKPVFGSTPASNTDSLLVNDPFIEKP